MRTQASGDILFLEMTQQDVSQSGSRERAQGIPLKVQQGPPPTGQADRFEEQ